MAWVRAFIAVARATRSERIISTCPSPALGTLPLLGLDGPRGGLGVQGVGLATLAQLPLLQRIGPRLPLGLASLGLSQPVYSGTAARAVTGSTNGSAGARSGAASPLRG
jgi:hypothetical protein